MEAKATSCGGTATYESTAMGLFDNLNFSVATKYGTVGLSGGKVSASANADFGAGIVPPTPTPLTRAVPTPAQTGIMGWLKSNPATAVGIGIAALLGLVFVLRR